MILDQIYNCHYQGAFYNIYLESKSMELILRLLWETAESREPKISDRFIPDHDKACIFRARDILIKAVDTPPSLKALAQKAGINDTKLKRGFRQMFGTTVFGYLRKYRMEQAEKILSQGTMNVDETAYTLGFHDTAHFIRQFRQHYGTTPGTYLKQVRAPGEGQALHPF
jgi:AraC-like DNA-binding protein